MLVFVVGRGKVARRRLWIHSYGNVVYHFTFTLRFMEPELGFQIDIFNLCFYIHRSSKVAGISLHKKGMISGNLLLFSKFRNTNL